jgi:uncharacterized membrane protein YidH (DUF202 family)
MNAPISIAFIVVGIVLLIVGFTSADSLQSAFSRLFSGHSTDKSVLLIVGACVCLAHGVLRCRGSRHT